MQIFSRVSVQTEPRRLWRTLCPFAPAFMAAVGFLPGFAVAEGPAGAASGAESATTTPAPEEIVVTAQKRSQRIQDVGMSVTVQNGEQLLEKGVTELSDLTQVIPSLQFSQTQSGTPVYTLRGVGYFEQSLSASPTVSIYQDEVPFPFAVMSRGVLLDTQRVEVLAGPQGTLYGQNATGGAINFIANKPTKTFSAGFDETFGRFNHNILSTFASGPLTSTLSARLAVSTDNGGAWQKSTTRDETLGDKNTQIARLTFDWAPSDRFSANLNINGWQDRSDTQAGQLEGIRLQAPQNIATGSISDPRFYRPAPVGSPAFLAYPPQIQAVVRQPIPGNDDRAADWLAGTHPRNEEHYYQTNLRMDYSLSDAVGLTSLTGYQKFTENNRVDQAGVGVPAETSIIAGNVTSSFQELRLHGVFDDKRVNWLLGANYEVDRTTESDFVSPFVSTASFSPVALGLPPFFDFTALNTDNVYTKSLFGNIEYKVLSTVDVHAGLRYTRSDQDMSGCSSSSYPSVTILQNAVGGLLASMDGGTSIPALPGQCVTIGPPPNFIPGLQRNTLDQRNVPWRVGIDWTPIPHNLFYFTVSKGFKAGSSPALGASRADQLTPVTQESLLAYELGSKSELFDRKLQLNLALFHYDYTNKQELGRLLDPVYGALQVLLNIPKSTEDGFEFSTVWRPISGLTLNLDGTYLDSKVTSHFHDTGPYPLGPSDLIDFYGEPFPFTPKWSLRYGARYDWNLTDDRRVFVSADASYQSSASAAFGSDEAAAQGAPPLRVDAYSLLNLSAGIEQGRWRGQIWGKNVTNKYYWTSVNYISDTVVKLTGQPRTYGITVSYLF
jgi:outer membrane receptor protein involved in Fe transport